MYYQPACIVHTRLPARLSTCHASLPACLLPSSMFDCLFLHTSSNSSSKLLTVG